MMSPSSGRDVFAGPLEGGVDLRLVDHRNRPNSDSIRDSSRITRSVVEALDVRATTGWAVEPDEHPTFSGWQNRGRNNSKVKGSVEHEVRIRSRQQVGRRRS